MGHPHISIRRHICWDPDNGGTASEPTSTVVLTSAGGYYVDIRILKDKPTDRHEVSLSTETLQRVDWAFAGTSTELEPPPGDGSSIMQWVHWVDSRHLNGNEDNVPKDVGRLFPADENGDTLETGRMAHPESGVETAYEELWGSVAIEGAGANMTKVSMVLQTTGTSPPRTGNGMVLRVGQFIQGVFAHNGELVLERWRLDEGKWTLQCRVGNSKLSLPCRHLSVEAPFAEGDTFDYEGFKWKVSEKQTWK